MNVVSAPVAARFPRASPYLLAALGVFLLHAWYLNCVAEDAFISLRFARNFAEGHGLVWNIGAAPVEGYTDFLWVMLCAGAMRLGLDALVTAQVLSLVSGAAVIVGTYRGARLLGWDPAIAAIPVALLAVSGPLATWATSAMEMPLFAALVVWSAVLVAWFWRTRRSGLLFAASLTLFLGALTRPEGVLVAGVLLGISGLVSLFQDRAVLKPIAAATLAFAVLFAAYWIWRASYFGYPFPNTFYAKTGGGTAQVVRGAMLAFIFYMQFGVPLLPWLLVALWAAPPARASLRPQRLLQAFPAHALLVLGLLLALGYTAYTIAVGGDYMAMHRFYVPVLPFMYLAAGACAAVLQKQDGGRHAAGFAAVLLVTLAGTFFPSTRLERGFFATPPVQHGDWRGVQTERWHVARLSVIGKFFRDYRRDYDESLATSAIGAIGYYSDMRVDDVHGLVDPHIAHLPAPPDFAKHRPGHGRSDLAYSFSRRPTYFMFARELTPQPITLWEYVPDSLRASVDRDYVHRSGWLIDRRNGEEGYFTFFERRDSAARRPAEPADRQPK